MVDNTHPSYGILALSRSNIGGKGTALFGSSIRHNDTIRLSISAGTFDRSGNQTRYYPKRSPAKNYVEVEMSFSQFAEVVTSFHVGEGVPVTVLSVNGQRMPACPYEDKQKLMRQEFKNLADSIASDFDYYTKQISALLHSKKTLSNADKDFILKTLKDVSAKINDHMPYINEMFAEQMEKTVVEAKGEFESFLQSKMNNLAIEAIAEQQKQVVKQEFGGLLPYAETVEDPEGIKEEEQSIGMNEQTLG